MSLPPDHPLAGRRRAPAFRPSFTLALLYLAVFFVVYALLLILPELLTVLRDVPPGPEQQQIAQETARRSFGPKAGYALGLALATIWAGARLQVLPGLRPR